MNKKTRTVRILIAAFLAVAFAGSGLATVATAMELSVAPAVYLASALGAAVCALAAYSGVGAVAAAALLALVGGGMAVTHLGALRSVGDFFASLRGLGADPARAEVGARTFLVLAAAAFSMICFLLLYHRELTSLAVMVLAAMLISSHAMSPHASLAASVPGLAAGAAAFALTGGLQRDASAARALVPAALAVALALLLVPAQRITWQPLEDLAEKVRSVAEQYFNFTQERMAFSIGEKGYNHGGEVDGEAVAMLGGPANPDTQPVMRVSADGDVLLRGTIRSTYTGYSWVDLVPKSRYLYYDLIRRSIRDRVFNLDFKAANDAFDTVKGRAELLDSGTSTLFIPGRLAGFDMDLGTAVYYNSAGEMFLVRDVQPGDSYAFEALVPGEEDAMRQAALWGETESDGQYAAIMAAHSELPQGVEDGLYALTMQITADSQDPYGRASAIADYLRRNMRYRLDVEYPPVGRDFVSWFVLDSREGYCSYFASAMAVMGRIAGLPTRYVEGYYARAGAEGEVTLTGEDAHAWAEVYFQGMGWVPFDATNGGPAYAGSDAGDTSDGDAMNDPGTQGGSQPGDPTGDDGAQETQSPFTDPSASPAPTPDGGDQGSQDGSSVPDNNLPEDTPTPEPSDQPPELPPDVPPDDPDTQPPEPPENQTPPDRTGLWTALAILLLLLLIALAMLWVRRRLRRADPEVLCAETRRAQQAAMIAYRANLTLLGCLGQYQAAGETPEAFAERVSQATGNPDFARFTAAVTANRYGRRPLRRDDVAAGLSAYRGFMKSMGRRERLRFAFIRVFRGLGDFEAIP